MVEPSQGWAITSFEVDPEETLYGMSCVAGVAKAAKTIFSDNQGEDETDERHRELG